VVSSVPETVTPATQRSSIERVAFGDMAEPRLYAAEIVGLISAA